MLTAAPLESERFGLRTFRATLDSVDIDRLFDELVASGADLAILRVPSREAHAIRGLARFGLIPIHADTLVSYVCDLGIHTPAAAAPDGFTIELADDGDRAEISELVTRVFTGYPTHYLANPLLDPAAILDGYRAWALSHIRGDNLVAWVARKDGRVASIACSAFDATTGTCAGVLHGVHPDFARGGIYTALIRHTQQHFQTLGFTRLTIQTQAWNMPVQRVWVREGFTLAEVYETFHVNALLNPDRTSGQPGVLAFTSNVQRDIANRLQSALADGPEPNAHPVLRRLHTAVFRQVPDGEACTLHARRYDFPHAHQSRIASATLIDAHGHPCASGQLLLEHTP